MKKYECMVFICRAQPYHLGHHQIVKTSLEISENLIIVLGSGCQPRDYKKNPWFVTERAEMIRNSLNVLENERVQITYARDYYDDDLWITEVYSRVEKLANDHRKNKKIPICLIGHSKDKTSYYLKKFPKWSSYSVDNVDGINATDIRKDLFSTGWIDREIVPNGTFNFLLEFFKTEAWGKLIFDYEWIDNYLKDFEGEKYHRVHHTTDSLVIQAGYILLGIRKEHPGKGLTCLPGGFLHEFEELFDGCLRELREETQLKVWGDVLKNCVVNERQFSDPFRSNRGRIITTAYHFVLEQTKKLPHIKGSDDLEKAFWLPISEIDSNVMFGDHYKIIVDMIGPIK